MCVHYGKRATAHMPNYLCACCCLGIAPRAQLLKKSAWLLHLNDGKYKPASHDGNELAYASNQCYYPQTGKGGLSWYMSSSQFWLVGLCYIIYIVVGLCYIIYMCYIYYIPHKEGNEHSMWS